MCTRAAALGLGIGLVCVAAAPAAAFELGELFRTPEQRAAARLAAGEHEALIERAPNARWEALGRYAAGDHVGAAEAFARALAEREARAESGEGTLSAAERDALLLDRATAETRAGRYAEALSLYERILARDPTNEDARHNRDIARALQALDERERGRGARDGGGSAGNGSDDAEAGERGGEPDASRQRETAGRDGSPSGSPDGSSAATDDGAEREEGGAPGETDGTASDALAAGSRSRADAERGGERAGGGTPDGRVDADDAAAREALAAERRRADGADDGASVGPVADGEGRDAHVGTADGAAAELRTPSEREQATEVWLRRIADDPAGLLRRRLERNHRDDYPEVGDGAEPW